VRNLRLVVVVIVLVLAGVAAVGYSLSNLGSSPASPSNTASSMTVASSSSALRSVTVTCYLDGCIPLPCPPSGCGPIVTTTVSGYIYYTRGTVTLNGTIKILPGTGSGVYFFDVGAAQYHLVFCNCTGTGPCNCPNIPAFKDGQKIRVTGTLVMPSTLGPVWAPGGDIYVQTWTST